MFRALSVTVISSLPMTVVAQMWHDLGHTECDTDCVDFTRVFGGA